MHPREIQNQVKHRFTADVQTAQMYYPFGQAMPGRIYNSDDYDYGFNGKEMDNEVQGNGNSYDYGFRIYNPRIGKFLSVDPLFKSYPWYTLYQFAGNMPTSSIDLDGLEEYLVIHWVDNEQLLGITIIKLENDVKIDENSKEVIYLTLDASILDEYVDRTPQKWGYIEDSDNDPRWIQNDMGENHSGEESKKNPYLDENGNGIEGSKPKWKKGFDFLEATFMNKGVKSLSARQRKKIEEFGGQLDIVMPNPEDIEFETGKANLKPKGKQALDNFAYIFKLFPDAKVHLTGHTDDVGDFERALK